MDNKWDEQYRIEEYRYGETPNLFFKEVKTLFLWEKFFSPADGEGRNGVYAAKTAGRQILSIKVPVDGKRRCGWLKKIMSPYLIK
jgi:hypothetical protein